MTDTDPLSIQVARSQGFLSIDQVACLKKLTGSLPPNSTVVVIGSGPGTATLAVAEKRQDLHIHSIDIKPAPGEKLNLENAGLGHLVEQITDDSKEVGKRWKRKVDFLIVDGCHRYPSVVGDILAWTPHLKDGAVIAFHDYGTEHDIWVQVKKAVDQHMVGQEIVDRAGCLIAFRWHKARSISP